MLGGGDAYPDSLSGLGLPTYAYRTRESLVNLRTRFAYAQIGASSADAPGRRGQGSPLPAGTRAPEKTDPSARNAQDPVACERKDLARSAGPLMFPPYTPYDWGRVCSNRERA
jgi:hypothetical protein